MEVPALAQGGLERAPVPVGVRSRGGVQGCCHLFGVVEGLQAVGAAHPVQFLKGSEKSVFGKVGGDPNGTPVGEAYGVEGPSALTGHGQRGSHVGVVEVWTLLAVHFDADPALVQAVGHFGVVKNFVRHHVAPMARGVADRDQQPRSLCRGAFEHLGVPLLPVHGLVGVLLQV